MAFRFEDWDETSRTAIDDRNIWNVMFPLGSIYFTVTNKSPEQLFPTPEGFDWKWEQLSNGFIYSTNGQLIAAGSTGGSDKITLKVSNLPTHSHTINHKHTRGTMEITGKLISDSTKDGTSGAFSRGGNAGDDPGWVGWTGRYYVNFNASKSWTGETSEPTNQESGTTGSNEPIQYMPPYVAVYAWKRIK